MRGPNVRRQLLQKGQILPQGELARIVHVAHGTVVRIENGFTEVHPQTIRKLAGALGVEPRELVKEKE